MLNISLQPEYIFSIFGFRVTNTLLTSFLVTIILVVLSVILYFKKNTKNIVVDGLKIVVLELMRLTDSVTGDRKLTKKILPLIATFFLFIVSANLLALIPGFLGSLFVATPEGVVALLRSPNSDLNTTLALALVSVFMIQFFSVSALGIKSYIGRFINFGSPVKLILGFFEIISETVKIVSFSFRLFGNVFAGEVLLLIIAFLVPYIIPLPFMILEIFVGIVQALIFAALSLTFIKTSTMRLIE